MIRINLLAVEREAKKKTATFQAGQKVTIACGFILVLTAAVIGWRYWLISRESSIPPIYNCNPRSLVRCFPFVDLDAALECGDTPLRSFGG